MTNLLQRLQQHTTRVAVSTYSPDTVTHLGSLQAKNATLQLGSFSKAVLSLTMRHDPEFAESPVCDGSNRPVLANDLLCHHLQPDGMTTPVYSYDGNRFRLALQQFLHRRQLDITELPALIKQTLGMKVVIADPTRPERSLITTHFDLHQMLLSVRTALRNSTPSSDPSALFHLGEPISTPQLQTGSPFFWSKDPAFALQHGGIVDRNAVLMLLAPEQDCGYVVSLEADDAEAAQVAVSELVSEQLAIPLNATRLGAPPSASFFCDEVDGWYVDGESRVRVRRRGEHLVLEAPETVDRRCEPLGSGAFVDVGTTTPRRYAHTFFSRPDTDGRAVGMVLDQRTYLRCPEGAEVST